MTSSSYAGHHHQMRRALSIQIPDGRFQRLCEQQDDRDHAHIRELPCSRYGQVAYRFNDRLQASAYYSLYYADRNDKDSEAHFMNGTAQPSPLDKPDGFEKDWTLFAVKTTFRF